MRSIWNSKSEFSLIYTLNWTKTKKTEEGIYDSFLKVFFFHDFRFPSQRLGFIHYSEGVHIAVRDLMADHLKKQCYWRYRTGFTVLCLGSARVSSTGFCAAERPRGFCSLAFFLSAKRLWRARRCTNQNALGKLSVKVCNAVIEDRQILSAEVTSYSWPT